MLGALNTDPQRASEHEDKLRYQAAELTTELAGLKAFLELHDKSDSSEITSHLNTINDLIFNFASGTAYDEIWKSGSSRGAGGLELCNEIRANLVGQAGLSIDMVEALQHCAIAGTQEEQLAVFQYALQASAVRACFRMLRRFCCGLEEAEETLWSEMADEIRRAGKDKT